jgi:hypothetical protein
LISFTRGSETQSWSLDAVGNWSSFTTNGSTQTRTSNLQNQISSISGASTPTYDYDGNTLTDDNGTVYTFDAWNRIVKAVSGTNTEIYSYDALARRIVTQLNGLPTDLYYSSDWQVLEDAVNGVVNAADIWSPVYVDALFVRTMNGKDYAVQQDANWNVTAVTDSAYNSSTGQYKPTSGGTLRLRPLRQDRYAPPEHALPLSGRALRYDHRPLQLPQPGSVADPGKVDARGSQRLFVARQTIPGGHLLR